MLYWTYKYSLFDTKKFESLSFPWTWFFSCLHLLCFFESFTSTPDRSAQIFWCCSCNSQLLWGSCCLVLPTESWHGDCPSRLVVQQEAKFSVNTGVLELRSYRSKFFSSHKHSKPSLKIYIRGKLWTFWSLLIFRGKYFLRKSSSLYSSYIKKSAFILGPSSGIQLNHTHVFLLSHFFEMILSPLRHTLVLQDF